MQQNEKNRFSSLVITNPKKRKVKTATKNNKDKWEYKIKYHIGEISGLDDSLKHFSPCWRSTRLG
jgi:hypothetical protein